LFWVFEVQGFFELLIFLDS